MRRQAAGLKKYDLFARPEVRNETRSTLGGIFTFFVPLAIAGYLGFILWYNTAGLDPNRSTTLKSNTGVVKTLRYYCETDECYISSIYGYWSEDTDNHASSIQCRKAGAEFGCTRLTKGQAVDVPMCATNSQLDGTYLLFHSESATIDGPGVTGPGGTSAFGRARRSGSGAAAAKPKQYIEDHPTSRGRKPRRRASAGHPSNPKLRVLETRTNDESAPLTAETATATSADTFAYGIYEGWSVESSEGRIPLTFYSQITLALEEVLSNTNAWRVRDSSEVDETIVYVSQVPRVSDNIFTSLNPENTGITGCFSDAVDEANEDNDERIAEQVSRVTLTSFTTETSIERPVIYVEIITQMGGFIQLLLEVLGIAVGIWLYIRTARGGRGIAGYGDKFEERSSDVAGGDTEMTVSVVSPTEYAGGAPATYDNSYTDSGFTDSSTEESTY
jgi:hypothetical protein